MNSPSWSDASPSVETASALSPGYAHANKSVLVTGAFGFIGSHLCQRLMLSGAKVVAADIDTASSRPSLLNVEPLSDGMRLMTIDVSDERAVRQLLATESFDVIYHLAAYAVVERAAEEPLNAIKTNTMGLVYLLEAIRERTQGDAHVTPTLVLTSTDKVYGETSGDAAEERDALHGVGVYDAAKLAADAFAQTYYAAYRCQTVVIRLCNVIGPGDFNACYRVVPRSLHRLFGQPTPEPPILYTDAIEHYRDYVYIDDVVEALLRLGTTPHCRGDVFNMTPAHGCSTPELLNALIECAARLEEERSPSRAAAIRRNGVVVREHDRHVLAIRHQHLNGKKIAAATGFSPAVSFEDGLHRTVTYYRDYFSRQWTF